MEKCELTETQKNMLRSLVQGLNDGTVKPEWVVLSGGNRITGIVGLDSDGKLWREVWKGIQFSDFDDFIECGLFRLVRQDQFGVPANYSLHKQRIIDLVESNFGNPMDEQSQVNQKPVKDKSVVFVVHGRNEVLRDGMFEFLRSIDLKPLEWEDAVKLTGTSSPYIGQILDAAFNKAQAIVVLMTPDDEARLREPLQRSEDESHEKDYTPQARANVIFEAGLALGRSPDQTILVEVGKLRLFSDIAGRHVIRLDNSQKKRNDFIKRLESAGCPIKLENSNWHEAGDFTVLAKTRQSTNDKTKRWRVRDKELISYVGRKAGFGAWEIDLEQANGQGIYGPYIVLKPGQYRAIFRLKLDNIQGAEENIAIIDVTSNQSGKRLNSRSLTTSDFSKNNSYQDFKLDFEIHNTEKEVEFRLNTNPMWKPPRKITLDYIILEQK